ncbi:MAG: hypothetical protein AAGI23_23230 [Bacteroidota bacterium]
MPDKNKPTNDEQLRLENEIQKINLEINLEINHGAEEFFVADDLPPDMEKTFLDNVTKFEEQYAKGDTISVHEFIGSPNAPNKGEVEDFETEIERILKLLEEKGVTIDRPDHLTPIGYYNFLTTDLFEHQMMNVRIPGMIYGFIYDEFRHDGPSFIEDHVEEFLGKLLTLDKPFEYEWLSETCRGSKDQMTKEEVLECIHHFRAQFDELTPVAFKKLDMQFHNGFMYFFFGIAWEGKRPNGETVSFEDGGISQLFFEDGEWMLQGIQMPGFQFEKV